MFLKLNFTRALQIRVINQSLSKPHISLLFIINLFKCVLNIFELPPIMLACHFYPDKPMMILPLDRFRSTNGLFAPPRVTVVLYLNCLFTNSLPFSFLLLPLPIDPEHFLPIGP